MSAGGRVLLLAPSGGLGGGIERYVSTIEAAFARAVVGYRRLDLLRPGRPGGIRRRVGFVREVRAAVRAEPGPVWLVLAHRNLLPVVRLAAGCGELAGASVILHGSEVWASGRQRGGWGLRRPGVRVVAASSFTAGAVARQCRAGVLPPGVPEGWYRLLVEAGDRAWAAGRDGALAAGEDGALAAGDPAAGADRRIAVVTAFRLASWREKGLPALLDALGAIADPRVRLTVCGSGRVPDDLAAMVARYPWCRLAPGLTDGELAGVLAGADLFVLCTRLRAGAQACGEGFGLVLLEAQLAGTPVVAPAHGGSADAFLPGFTGVAPADESPAALAAVLAPLLADGSRRAELGRAAAAWARAGFAPDRYARRAVAALLPDPSWADPSWADPTWAGPARTGAGYPPSRAAEPSSRAGAGWRRGAAGSRAVSG